MEEGGAPIFVVRIIEIYAEELGRKASNPFLRFPIQRCILSVEKNIRRMALTASLVRHGRRKHVVAQPLKQMSENVDEQQMKDGRGNLCLGH